jgi:hypothetical protein
MAYLNNYHLKGSIKGQKSKHTLSGSYPHFPQIPPTKMPTCMLHLLIYNRKMIWELTISG